ncbi:hypothetical protein [Novosphingobium sp. Leaf2]|uniref:hypothetical protein n=1 Tax=Novosphingobium sp. Leaf2 TaxID=1735670 RepID=UPI0006FEA1D8|nr:hypothetical protein [Novosphingobium sp. Leaf2]KQM18384.1 hypothetical protein ASE49_09240 [Novosphingobium sp. Leaf2]
MSRTTYRATADGFLSAESRYVKADEVFSTDEDLSNCSWAEDITPAEVKKQTKADAKIVEAEKDKPDGSGISAETLKLKN